MARVWMAQVEAREKEKPSLALRALSSALGVMLLLRLLVDAKQRPRAANVEVFSHEHGAAAGAFELIAGGALKGSAGLEHDWVGGLTEVN